MRSSISTVEVIQFLREELDVFVEAWEKRV